MDSKIGDIESYLCLILGYHIVVKYQYLQIMWIKISMFGIIYNTISEDIYISTIAAFLIGSRLNVITLLYII